jgi:hypothetical protein
MAGCLYGLSGEALFKNSEAHMSWKWDPVKMEMIVENGMICAECGEFLHPNAFPFHMEIEHFCGILASQFMCTICRCKFYAAVDCFYHIVTTHLVVSYGV